MLYKTFQTLLICIGFAGCICYLLSGSVPCIGFAVLGFGISFCLWTAKHENDDDPWQ